MNNYNPNEAIEDQAADAMQLAVSICKAAGWSSQSTLRLADMIWEQVAPATPSKGTKT